jgi:hypothetical protein
MRLTDFRGARGSNTGDDFHELWATRHAIRLLSNDEDLQALAVEGLAARDEAAAPDDTWDGVDCTLYFGGSDATAERVVLEQLKYSAASPDSAWTVARLTGGARRDRSVIARLAKAWKGLKELRPSQPVPNVVLISNQPVDPEIISAFVRAALAPTAMRKAKPKETSAGEVKLAYASGLDAAEFQEFSAAIKFEGGAGSRFALEEQVLQAIADWTDLDVQRVVTGLRDFVRHRMRPEFAGELITRASVMLHLGVSDGAALFPCPSEITQAEAPVSRAAVRNAINRLCSGVQYMCLHGMGGVGKTTALQEIEAGLPTGSVVIKYDCYGGGRYLDPSALRHRSADAFLQLTNELSARLKLPLLLSRHHGSDYPKLFANRLRHAAKAVAVQHPGALLVIAIDAADNAITAAHSRVPAEAPFVHDFVRLTGIPDNVRFVVTARSGRLPQLLLPTSYEMVPVEPFSLTETAENVSRVWSAPESWIDDFHHLTNGVPRVQTYAFEVDNAHPSTALDRLRPAGKSLDEVFRQQFQAALSKGGNPAELARLCAGLIALPRPVPLPDLAGVLGNTVAQLSDVCADLAPGIRVHQGAVSFADEDFEEFVRKEGIDQLEDIQQGAASWLLDRAAHNQYAALNVAGALVSAHRGAELLDLVEREPAPAAVLDPVLRREAELQRLRLAITVCRQAHDISRALRFVLIGAEGIKTETALRQMLVDNPDMAASYAEETAGRLILSDPEHVEDHGPFLFHKLSVDADRGDAFSVREGRRLLTAWMQARKHRYLSAERSQYRSAWEISISDISSLVEATLKLDGPAAALEALGSWTPKCIRVEVALSLPLRFVAEGRVADIEAIASDDQVGPIGKLLLLIPLALAGRPVDINLLATGLQALSRRKLRLQRFFDGYQDSSSHALVLDAVLTACEILTSKGYAPELVDKVLGSFLAPKLHRIERRHVHEGAKLDLLFRAYALNEVRAGRTPTTKGIFEPRPVPTDARKQRETANDVDRHDRPLMEFAGAVFDIYVAIADGLVHRRTNGELSNALRQAIGTLKQETWRISRQHGSDALLWRAAKSLLVLRAAGYDPHELQLYATEIYGQWRSGREVPNEQFVSRLSLNQELHATLLQDLAAAAAETCKLRIGAEQKSATLVGYARAIKLISPDDANAVFNYAVEAASELDREVMAQVRLLDKLSARGDGAFSDPRGAAKHVATVVADAAIRLDGYDRFPWNESLAVLTRLDAPLALANAARWDDELVAQLRDSLPPLIRMALHSGALSPSQAAAITLFIDRDEGLLAEVLKRANMVKLRNLPTLAEEAAYDVLMRKDLSSRDPVTRFIEQNDLNGQWTGALRRQEHFLANTLSEPKIDEREELEPQAKTDNSLNRHIWDRDTLLDSVQLQAVSTALLEQCRAEGTYLSIDKILRSATCAVSPRDRVDYLSALAKLDGRLFVNEATEALLETIEAWWSGPAVKHWCRINLPEVIVKRLPSLWYSLQYRKDRLTPALEKTGLSANERQDLILQGVARHVDSFGSESIFALASLVGDELPPSEAAVLASWYAQRLADRIPVEDRDQVPVDSALPRDINEAVARFIYAYMGDFDLRNRWRAAHAVRRLARVDDKPTLKYLIAQYGRRDEIAFRAPRLNFYWLAARLWFVIAWDRVSGERPDIASLAGPTLLQIALDDSFPHLLVRSFARDACEKLEATGHLVLGPDEKTSLGRVNETQIARAPAAKSTRRHFSHKDEKRRFKFDSMDTLPYWYEPLLHAFANLDGNRFLGAVEHWIIDVWGYDGDVRDFDKEPRRGRLNGDWSLSSNRHGSAPTLERLNHHLEWHGMWCAAGELLKTMPLVSCDDDDWDQLDAQIRREKLSEPPLWSADLMVPIPLVARNFRADNRSIHEWALGVEEIDHRAEMFLEDQPQYVVVDGHAERRTGNGIEVTSVASALVAPATGSSLLRALQTMHDAWDYKLPDEDDGIEIDQEPFRLLGWLRSPRRDNGIDEKDPFRGYASTIQSFPGRRVTEVCSLTRDVTGRARWHTKPTRPPMFIYEAWGEHDKDDEQYSTDLGVAGWRMLVHKDQLQEFLRNQGLDLIIEVEVTRRERKTRQYNREEEIESPEGRFDRLYRLRADGGLEVAEGHLGTWTGDCPGT